jgi:hypothetical protein
LQRETSPPSAILTGCEGPPSPHPPLQASDLMTTNAVVYHSIVRIAVSQKVPFERLTPKDVGDYLHILAGKSRIHTGARMIARPC